jgi:hypothetical protein
MSEKNQKLMAIYEAMRNLIPAELWRQYAHLPFEKMAIQPELKNYRKPLEKAAKAWKKIEA